MLRCRTQTFLREAEIDYQLVPPRQHCRKAAKLAIRTFKNPSLLGCAASTRTSHFAPLTDSHHNVLMQLTTILTTVATKMEIATPESLLAPASTKPAPLLDTSLRVAPVPTTTTLPLQVPVPVPSIESRPTKVPRTPRVLVKAITFAPVPRHPSRRSTPKPYGNQRPPKYYHHPTSPRYTCQQALVPRCRMGTQRSV